MKVRIKETPNYNQGGWLKMANRRYNKMWGGGKLPRYFHGGTHDNPWDWPYNNQVPPTGPEAGMPYNFPVENGESFAGDPEGLLPTPEKQKTGHSFNPNLTAGDAFQLAGYAAPAIYNFIQSVRPYERVSPIYNPEREKIKNLMASRKYNEQHIVNEINLSEAGSKRSIDENTSSDAIKRTSNVSASLAGLREKIKARMQGELMNAGFRGEEANVLNQLGQQEVAADLYAQEATSQNKARRQAFGAAAAGQFGQGLVNYGQARNQYGQDAVRINAMQNMFKNFGLDSSGLQEKINQGLAGWDDDGNLIIFKNI